jgi:hypothetical protein
MEEWIKGRLTHPAAVLPTPSALFAATHVTGTAQMSVVLTRERGAVKLFNSSGKLQYEQYLTELGFRPTEPLMQEWILGQICFNGELFDANQRDPKMTNPTSTEMMTFLYTQCDLLFERRGIAKSARAYRVLMIKDQQPLSSDEDSSTPTLPTGEIMAIYGRPYANTRGSERVAPYVRVCPACSGLDGKGTCVSSVRSRASTASLLI